jgi:hypothetical protein
MTTVLLYKGIRDDQTLVRQAKAGRYYTPDRDKASEYGDVIECRVVEFKKICVADNPHALALEWGKDKAFTQFTKRRNQLPKLPIGMRHERWPAYHACYYGLEKILAREARHRGYDGIHYKWWHTYAKL